MIGPILAGAGAGIGALNQYLAGGRQDAAIRDAIANRSRIQDEIDASLMGEIGTLRGMTPEEERASAMNEFVARLRDARASQPTSYGARGAMSDREAAGLSELTGDLGQFSNREADITSRLDSQRRMREKEGLGIAREGTDLRLLGNKMSSRDFLDQMRIARRSRPNPWLNMLGEGLKGAGMAMGGMSGGGSSMAGMMGGDSGGYSAAAQRAGTGNYVYGGN